MKLDEEFYNTDIIERRSSCSTTNSIKSVESTKTKDGHKIENLKFKLIEVINEIKMSTEINIDDILVFKDNELQKKFSGKPPPPPKSYNLNEALELVKFGKFNYFLMLVSGVILSTVLLETLGISFILPFATCDLYLTPKEKGALSAIAFAGIISSSHLWGFLADTKGRRRIIYPALFIAFNCSLLSSLCNNFWQLLILRYLAGFFVSAGSATIYAYLGEFHNEKIRARAIMGASTVFGVGCMTLPILSWLVLNQQWSFDVPVIGITYKPWRFFLIVCSIPTALSAIALYKMPESPKFLFLTGEHDKTISVLKQIYKVNVGKNDKEYPVTLIVDNDNFNKRKQQLTDENDSRKQMLVKLLCKIRDQTWPLFKPPFLKSTLIACILQFGIFVTSNGMYMVFPDILNRAADFKARNGGNQTDLCTMIEQTAVDVIAIENAVVNPSDQCAEKLDVTTFENALILEILYAVGFAVIGLLIGKLGKLSILVLVFLGCGICGILSVFIEHLQVAIALYVILLCCGLAIAVVNSATVDLYPTSLRAMGVCISLMMGRLGSVVGSYVVGIFIEHYCRTTFIGSGVSLIVCGILSFCIPNILKKNNQPEVKKTETQGSSSPQSLDVAEQTQSIDVVDLA